METVTEEGEMSAYRYNGFWSLMDTLRNKKYLEELWKIWIFDPHGSVWTDEIYGKPDDREKQKYL